MQFIFFDDFLGDVRDFWCAWTHISSLGCCGKSLRHPAWRILLPSLILCYSVMFLLRSFPLLVCQHPLGNWSYLPLLWVVFDVFLFFLVSCRNWNFCTWRLSFGLSGLGFCRWKRWCWLLSLFCLLLGRVFRIHWLQMCSTILCVWDLGSVANSWGTLRFHHCVWVVRIRVVPVGGVACCAGVVVLLGWLHFLWVCGAVWFIWARCYPLAYCAPLEFRGSSFAVCWFVSAPLELASDLRLICRLSPFLLTFVLQFVVLWSMS